MNLLILIFAHLIADYPLQGDFLAKMKGQNFIALVSHAGIWTGVISVGVYLLGYEVTYIDVGLLFIVHTIADYAKAKPVGVYKRLDPLKGGLLLDQLIHVIQILTLMACKGMM